MSYEGPSQSGFRVAAVLRFVRTDGTEDTIEAVNAEAHDANIRGAICAERAGLCQFQRDEATKGARITRVVCATDAPKPIFPGPLCREFIHSTCDPDTEIVATGADGAQQVVPISALLPLPSVYRRRNQAEIKECGCLLGPKVSPPAERLQRLAYEAAVACAQEQKSQAFIFPVLLAAAVVFEDGRVSEVPEMKGIEYGCTVDAVTLLLPELRRVKRQGGPKAVCIVQADHRGVAHAPFASARSLLIEHGFGDLLLGGHDDKGTWEVLVARDSLPHASHTEIF